MSLQTEEKHLPKIPVLVVGSDWVLETLVRESRRVDALLDVGLGRFPAIVVGLVDHLSRRWLKRHDAQSLDEIDRIAAHVGRPGAYFLNVSYEWGCTCRVAPASDGGSAMLLRVLDWPDLGLGRNIIAVRVASPVGRWLTLTWPGYTGVLQAIAPGRFAAALNQAPMDAVTGIFPIDWLVARAQIWRRPYAPAAHLLRQVFETAKNFSEARRLLIETPIAASAIFSLTGIQSCETCVIERQPDDAQVIDGPAVAANAWGGTAWTGRPRGEANDERLEAMRHAGTSLDASFAWLRPPILNDRTRLAFIADAKTGAFLAQGFEPEGPATGVLRTKA